MQKKSHEVGDSETREPVESSMCTVVGCSNAVSLSICGVVHWCGMGVIDSIGVSRFGLRSNKCDANFGCKLLTKPRSTHGYNRCTVQQHCMVHSVCSEPTSDSVYRGLGQ